VGAAEVHRGVGRAQCVQRCLEVPLGLVVGGDEGEAAFGDGATPGRAVDVGQPRDVRRERTGIVGMSAADGGLDVVSELGSG
jgi:hypothetical protein